MLSAHGRLRISLRAPLTERSKGSTEPTNVHTVIEQESLNPSTNQTTMPHIHLRPDWHIAEHRATSEDAYRSRRQFIRQLGLGGIAATTIGMGSGLTTGCVAQPLADPDGPLDTIPDNAPRTGLPATRNADYAVPERPLTTRMAASSYNNYYEFISQGDLKTVWPLTGDYNPFPHTIEVRGLVEKKRTFGVDELISSLGIEERVCRFRCVEAWSMTIPWIGFPLAKLIAACAPLSRATHVRFYSVDRPKEMPGIRNARWFDFPYYEALRMDEAVNELAFVATGMYGEPLPKQNGSPLRLVLPWKYGYKGAKAISRIEFVDEQPPTFWQDLYPKEYGFLSNVNPNLPHPRWTQAQERLILDEDRLERIPTQLFNGYADVVGHLYPDEPTEFRRGVVR